MAEQYKHSQSTGSGSNHIELHLNDDATATIQLVSNWMGLGKHHYDYSGTHKIISPVHGWILIDSLKHQDVSNNQPVESFHVSLIERKEIILEYFKIASSPYLEAPSELGAMKDAGYADWNESFELLLILQSFDEGHLYEILQNDYLVLDAAEAPDKAQVEILVHALLNLEKKKFYKAN
jgi:hypothetical protein